MELSRTYEPYTRLNHPELDGLINRLDREIDMRGDASAYYLVGARTAAIIFRHYSRIANQDDFVRLFNHLIHEWEDVT